jgi:signal transduction histidine kinase/ActR/RegA family two-component response regulator
MDNGGYGEGLATQPATARHWRTMLTVVGIATLTAAAALFAPTLQLPDVPAAVPAYGTCVTVSDLLTCYLMFSQFNHNRRARLALLGGLYFYCGLIVWPQLLFFPMVVTEAGLFGAGPQGSVWLWAFWHFGYLLFMLCFLLGGGLADGKRLEQAAATRMKWLTIAVPPLLVLGLSILVICGHDLLPALIHQTDTGHFVRIVFSKWLNRSVYNLAVILVVVAIAVGIPIIKRCRRVIDLGLVVAFYASLLDTGFNVIGDSRFSLGWYFARASSVLSSFAVLVIYLNEMMHLHLKAVENNRALAAKTAELVAAKEGAEAANRSKSAFLATMSHEIRTPINAILGLAHLLDGTGLDGDRRDFVGKIDAAGRSLLSIVNDVLDVSRVEAGQLQLDDAPFCLDDILGGLHAILSIAACAKAVSVEIEADPDVPRQLHGDGYRLQQILINIAGNAVKFTESGKVSVRVAVAEHSANRVRLRFRVDDTGIGIPAAKLPTLFEAFTQADSSTTRRYGGSGLGLTIAKRLVELMDGTIDADSEEGRGSTFRVTVALGVVPADSVPVAADRDQAAPAKPVDGLADIRILVVEDNALNRDILQRMMERRGATVAVAENGRVAVDRLRMDPDAFDVVLMDVQMPVMDGYEATREIRSALGLVSLPIIAVTAGVMAGEQESALAAGMTDFVGKPYAPTDLVRVIRRHFPVDPCRPMV